jgi:Undecaprenyl-phosphate glucose phosphotransferase
MSVANESALADEARAATRKAEAPGPQPVLKVAGGERRGPLRPVALSPTRLRINGAVLQAVFQAVDAALVTALALLVLTRAPGGSLLQRPLGEAAPLVLGALTALWGLRAGSTYRFTAREAVAVQLGKLIGVFSLAAAVAVPLAGLLSGPAHAFRVGAWTVAAGALVGTAHLWARVNVRRWRTQGRLLPNIVLVGATQNAARLIEASLKTKEAAVLGIFDDRIGRVPAAIRGVPVLGDTESLMNHKILPYVDRIVVAVSSASQPRVRELVSRLSLLPNRVTLFLDVGAEDGRAAALSRLGDLPLAEISGAPGDLRRACSKRVQDLVLGGLLLVAALPIMGLVALLIRLDSPGPILFCQRRHGFNNETITVCKFRSMRHEHTDHCAERQVSAGDDRITRIGRFIRRTSLDELPQLWNVLRGEMSLVGPRPHAIGMKTAGEESAKLVAEYAWRHRVKPGITGWAQINGSRGPVHTRDEVRRRVRLDVEYIERQSFWFDLYILAMTLPRLLGDKHSVR